MNSLTDEKKNLLLFHGVKDWFHDKSILDYPKIEEWMKSAQGDKFLSGDKDLVLFGNWEAVIVGNLIQRWFLLSNSTGAVASLVELYESLSEYNEETFIIKDYSTLFIEDFQNNKDCPLNARELNLVIRHLKDRSLTDSYIRTIIHTTEKELTWYPSSFVSFINDCFLWLEI